MTSPHPPRPPITEEELQLVDELFDPGSITDELRLLEELVELRNHKSSIVRRENEILDRLQFSPHITETVLSADSPGELLLLREICDYVQTEFYDMVEQSHRNKKRGGKK